MTLQELKEKLDNMEGDYRFDFGREEDCLYLFEQYGGEENMKEKFPRTYGAFWKTRKNAADRNGQCAEPAGQTGIYSGKIGKLAVERTNAISMERTGAIPMEKQPDDLPACRLKTELSCNFLDGTKEVCDEEPAEEWKGIVIQVKIKEKNSPKYLINKSIVVDSAHQYHNFVHTMEKYESEYNNKEYDVRMEVTGRDPSGILHKQVTAKSFKIGDVEEYNIYNVVLDDPSAKNAKHQNSGEIVMLYGRMNEQSVYADADYKGGDYYANTFSNEQVHLLLPLKGEIILDYKVKPVGLTKPGKGETLSRSTATYDYKGQEFTYRPDLNDGQLYEKMKGCFEADTYMESVRTKVRFDIRIPDTGRSDLDWHSDVKGIQNGDPKTVMLDGCFTYSAKNALDVVTEDQISITSRNKKFMAEAKKNYYEFDRATNTVYIPPITIYWGCFARETLIGMADGSEKEACDIRPGDLVMGYGKKELEVEDVVTGRDQMILLIETKAHGSIRVSGGHPMMCGGELKRAASVEPGDRLDLADGGHAEVVRTESVEYDDTVYNFTFAGEEEGAWLIANGFYSGDLRMQNKKSRKKKTPLTQEDREFIDEMKAFQRMCAGEETELS